VESKIHEGNYAFFSLNNLTPGAFTLKAKNALMNLFSVRESRLVSDERRFLISILAGFFIGS
jgi:hypothetical protein